MTAPQPARHDDWSAFALLLGEWSGEGGGDPGQGSGSFTFRPELDGRILLRANYADYPATAERPAFSHQDLMVVYRNAGDPRLRAIYFDSEGHVIQYAVTASADGDTVQFLSDVSPAAPTYRLTYTRKGPDTLAVTFDIAPAGAPDQFATYIRSTARKTADA